MAERLATKIRSRDGTAIAVDKVGKGPAVVFVDPALSYRASNPQQAQLAGLLAPHYTVFTYDRRGRGESGDTQPYAVEREIEDLDAVIRQAGDSAFVLGHSSGAVLALKAGVRGVPISRLVMYEPPFIIDNSRPPIPGDYLARLKELISAGRRGDAMAHFMTEAVGVPREMVAQIRNAPMWESLEKVAHTLPYDNLICIDNMVGKPLAAKDWDSFKGPTLVLDGDASPASMRNAAQAITDVLSNATRRSLPGQTHAMDPVIVAPILEEFFGS